ncbi:zinc finger E-box-binding homeobox 1-like [Chironomus tepperi]|uniref:zinc finger E-box-binding homeobox 1-like n=1 Tax=Chironomus tepperi TaxID=113505 RepID=UPI00391F6962
MEFLPTPEETMRTNFRNVITLLEVLYKRVIEQEIILNDIKIFLANRNQKSEEQNSFNPLDFLIQSDNEDSHQDVSEESSSTTVNKDDFTENSMEIACFDCMQVFKRGTGAFTRHLHTTPCKPYKCDICAKLFKKKSNMMTHKLTHSEDILSCDLCPATFKCRKYLDNHRNRKHKIVKTENVKYVNREIKEETVDYNGNYELEPPKKRVRYEINSEDFDQFLSRHLH